MNNAQLVKQILNNISGPNYFSIKRSFGKTLENCNIDAVIAYSKIADSKNDSSFDRNIEFLVMGLCYNSIKPNSVTDKTRINFETLLKRLTFIDKDKSKPRTAEIENFLTLRIDNNGYFAKKFVSLSKKVIPMLNPNEIINYEQLLDDLKHWNNGNIVKIRWAMTIANIEQEEN